MRQAEPANVLPKQELRDISSNAANRVAMVMRDAFQLIEDGDQRTVLAIAAAHVMVDLAARQLGDVYKRVNGKFPGKADAFISVVSDILEREGIKMVPADD